MPTKLKYDRFSNKVFLILMLVMYALILLHSLGSVWISRNGIESFSQWHSLIGSMFILNLALPLAFLFTWLFITSSVYISRLTRNGFKVPYKSKECGGCLRNVPHEGEYVYNRYRSDSIIAFIVSLVLYGLFAVSDILCFIKWVERGQAESVAGAYVFALIIALAILVAGFIFFRQRDPNYYVDEVDLPDAKMVRKTRKNITSAVLILLMISAVVFGVFMLIDQMADYIYRSKNGPYDKTYEDFLAGATMEVTSDSLEDGRWTVDITNTSEGGNRSPQLSFEEVEGASYYVIYMTDITAGSWVHWYATGITQTELEEGANLEQFLGDENFLYVGPYPPEGGVDHTYEIFVFAMEGDPGLDPTIKFDESGWSADLLYYTALNIKKSGSDVVYGNVIAYGYISGTYSR